jgi:hypothetical protein
MAGPFSPPPDSPDYMTVAENQRSANRPIQTTPFGASMTYEQAPGKNIGKAPKMFAKDKYGQTALSDEYLRWVSNQGKQNESAPWYQKTSFSGPLQDAATSLAAQAGGLSTPMDWAQFGELGNGEEARQQAIDAAYNQATKRLDPAFAQQGEALRTQLINQGLDPNSQAGRAAAVELSNSRNDAYSSAMNAAIQQGEQAANSVFRNNLQQRQQMIAEALTQRGQPVNEMRAMLPLFNMPGVPQDQSMLQAAGMQGNYDMAGGDFSHRPSQTPVCRLTQRAAWRRSPLGQRRGRSRRRSFFRTRPSWLRLRPWTRSASDWSASRCRPRRS